jgi:glycosyltransferase involved in cell wall biosynthesis
MAAGLPVISTRVGAVQEQVVDGVSGYLMDDNQPATIRSYVLRLVENRDQMQEMGRAGRLLAEEKFNAKTNYHRLLEYLKETAACSRA